VLNPRPLVRVVVDNDWAGDPDGLVALAHHLLAPSNRVDAITSSFTSPTFGPSEGTAAGGASLARELTGLIGAEVPGGFGAGPDLPFAGVGRRSDASAAILAAARSDDPLPLTVVCGGPLTNVADALAEDPGIAARMTLAWVGGSVDPEAFEYNRDTDAEAARFVLGHPELRIRQFPVELYRTMACSLAELRHDLGGAGRVGTWLWERFDSLPIPDFVELGPTWALGDSAPLVVTGLDPASSRFRQLDGDRWTICEAIDFRLVLADLLALLRALG